MECWIRRVSIAITLGACLVAAPAASAPALAAIAPSTPALSNVANVSVGGGHACAVDGSGALYCWGSNATGQLGVSGIPYSDIPVRVTGMGSGIASVSAGSGHTCALTTSATVKCWGSNSNGQLGNGSTIDSATAVDVAGLSGVTALSAGTDYTCAVANGAARCWGSNRSGQLGDSTTISRTIPITVSGLSSGATGIAAGFAHSCAVANGGARCWGSNNYGQLGDSTATDSTVPVDAAMVGTATDIAVGQYHSCARLNTGGMRCWGLSMYGQIGNGLTAFIAVVPANVSGLSSGVSSISAAGMQSCAIVNGGAKCWGANPNGELGDGTTTYRSIPSDVSGLSAGMLGLALGESGGCAITADARAMCWGHRILGNGTGNGYRSAPTGVFGLDSGASAIGAGKDHTCAVKNGGAVCWGRNTFGQLGNDTSVDSAVPVTVSGLTSNVVLVSGGQLKSCALLQNGAVKCWGQGYAWTPTDVPELDSGVAALSVGGSHACVLMTSGAARCWGYNAYGELGDGSPVSSFQNIPVTVTGMTSGTLAISAGTRHTCAIVASGGVRCWGYGSNGALGNNTTPYQQITPVDVTDIASGATAVAAGINHSCALVGGVVYCWGYNQYGSLGDGTRAQSNTPVLVSGLPTGVTALIKPGAYASQTCAITPGGAAYCWGANYSAQVGDGTVANRLAATPVAYLGADVTQIVGGGDHTCALTSAGAVKCWGSRRYGQVGDGSGFDYSTVPVYVGNPLPLNPIRTFFPGMRAAN